MAKKKTPASYAERTWSTSLPDSLHRVAEKEMKRRGCSRSELVRVAIGALCNFEITEEVRPGRPALEKKPTTAEPKKRTAKGKA